MEIVKKPPTSREVQESNITRREIQQIAQMTVAKMEARLHQLDQKTTETVTHIQGEMTSMKATVQTLHETAVTKAEFNTHMAATMEGFDMFQQRMLDGMRSRLAVYESLHQPQVMVPLQRPMATDQDTEMEDSFPPTPRR